MKMSQLTNEEQSMISKNVGWRYSTVSTLSIKINTGLSIDEFREWANNHVQTMKNDGINILGYCAEQHQESVDNCFF